MIIQPIVEGHGEVGAIPVLLRRFLAEAGVHNIDVGKPIRRKRSELVQQASVQRSVRLALLQPECGGILIVFDSDDDCPKDLASQIKMWAKTEAGAVPCEVVMAHREYEAWFLASLEALRGVRGIVMDAAHHATPEIPRNAKGELRRHMSSGRGYSESVDQAAMTAQMDFAAAHRGCRSFRKMVKAFGNVMSEMGVVLTPWPPGVWNA